jgi:hypothetical protein
MTRYPSPIQKSTALTTICRRPAPETPQQAVAERLKRFSPLRQLWAATLYAELRDRGGKVYGYPTAIARDAFLTVPQIETAADTLWDAGVLDIRFLNNGSLPIFALREGW